MAGRTREPITLTQSERDMLIEAIDSHLYWQLSDEHYRNSGMVEDPGSDDRATRRTMARYMALADKLE